MEKLYYCCGERNEDNCQKLGACCQKKGHCGKTNKTEKRIQLS